jgi:hypothetical protein
LNDFNLLYLYLTLVIQVNYEKQHMEPDMGMSGIQASQPAVLTAARQPNQQKSNVAGMSWVPVLLIPGGEARVRCSLECRRLL